MAKQDSSLTKHSATERKRRHVPLDVERAIEKLALRGYAPIQIFRHLEENPELKGKLPSLRTVQTIVRQTLPRDTSVPWTLEDAKADDAPLVLEVLAAVIEMTEGRVSSLSCDKVACVLQVRRAADVPPWEAYLIAVMYKTCREAGGDTKDLDIFLAFAPWRGSEALARYNNAFQSGYIGRYFALRDGQLWSVGGGSPHLSADSIVGK